MLPKNFVSVIRAFKDANPAKLNDKLLLEYHKKTHMLYSGNINRTPPNKQFINFVVDLHDSFVNEMLKRGFSHHTPLKKI